MTSDATEREIKPLLLRFTVVFLVLLLSGEILTRLWVTSPTAIVEDELLGWMYQPNHKIRFTREGYATNQLNALGFNEDEWSPDDKRTSILVFGDSFTESLHVNRPDNFESILERDLPCLNLVNLGRSGFSPVHYPAMFKRYKQRYETDEAVIVVAANDMYDFDKSDFKVIDDKETGEVAEIVLQPKELHSVRLWIDPFLKNSSLFSHIYYRLNQLRADAPNPVGKKVKAADMQLMTNKQKRILRYTIESASTLMNLKVVYIPSLRYRERGVLEETRVSDAFWSEIKSLTTALKVPVLSAREYLIKSFVEHRALPMGFPNKDILGGHLNETGHEALAMAMAELLGARGHHNRNIDELNR
jgi:hypothetical protein